MNPITVNVSLYLKFKAKKKKGLFWLRHKSSDKSFLTHDWNKAIVWEKMLTQREDAVVAGCFKLFKLRTSAGVCLEALLQVK